MGNSRQMDSGNALGITKSKRPRSAILYNRTCERVKWNEPGVFDERTGWKDTRYVCVKRMGNEVYAVPQCIGMCATKFPCAFSVRYLCVDTASGAETAK